MTSYQIPPAIFSFIESPGHHILRERCQLGRVWHLCIVPFEFPTVAFGAWPSTTASWWHMEWRMVWWLPSVLIRHWFRPGDRSRLIRGRRHLWHKIRFFYITWLLEWPPSPKKYLFWTWLNLNIFCAEHIIHCRLVLICTYLEDIPSHVSWLEQLNLWACS